MINTQAEGDGRLQVVNMHRIVFRRQAQFVRAPDDLATFDAAAGQPHAEAVCMVIPPNLGRIGWSASIRQGGASEFPSPDDQRLVQQVPLLEILHQGRHLPVRGSKLLAEALVQVRMMVPLGVLVQHEPHSALNQAARQQTGRAIVPRRSFARTSREPAPAHPKCRSGAAPMLHPKRQFIGLDAHRNLLIRSPSEVLAVEFADQVKVGSLHLWRDAGRVGQMQDRIALAA